MLGQPEVVVGCEVQPVVAHVVLVGGSHQARRGALETAGFHCQVVLLRLGEVVEGGGVSVEEVGALDGGQEIYGGFLALKVAEFREGADEQSVGGLEICC